METQPRSPAAPQPSSPAAHFRVAALLLLSIGAAATSSARPPDTFAYNSTQLGDATCGVKIQLEAPYAPGPGEGFYRLSGTDCNITLTTPSAIHDDATLTVTEVQLKLASEVIQLPVGFKKGRVRFASTHFEDSEDDVVIEWKAKFQYEDPAHGFSGTSDWVVAQFHFDPYNKGLSFGTRVHQNGSEQPAVMLLSERCAGAARDFLSDLGHSIPHGSSWINEAGLHPQLATITCLFGLTHGSVVGFNDSYTAHSNPANLGLVVWSEAELDTEPRTGNHVPKFNYVLLYSCDTLSDDGNRNAHFNMAERDSVYLGFPKALNPALALENTEEFVNKNQLNGLILHHIEAMFEKWLAYATIQQAVTHANGVAMPRGAPVPVGLEIKYPKVEPKLKGDVRTTIRAVYLTQAEFDAANTTGSFTPYWYHAWSDD